ncbi:MAG: hypothetical protein ACI4XE_02460, partial [Acutalibacteraceae bacterium]
LPSNGLTKASESMQRTLLVRVFSAEFFLALRAEKKLRVENAIGTLFYRPISFGVRHSGIQLKGTKFSNRFFCIGQIVPLNA